MAPPRSRLPCGKHKGMPVEQCPTDYLPWMASKRRDTDLHEFAIAAEEVLKTKSPRETQHQNLDQAAGDFLKRHGINPQKPSP